MKTEKIASMDTTKKVPSSLIGIKAWTLTGITVINHSVWQTMKLALD